MFVTFKSKKGFSVFLYTCLAGGSTWAHSTWISDTIRYLHFSWSFGSGDWAESWVPQPLVTRCFVALDFLLKWLWVRSLESTSCHHQCDERKHLTSQLTQYMGECVIVCLSRDGVIYIQIVIITMVMSTCGTLFPYSSYLTAVYVAILITLMLFNVALRDTGCVGKQVSVRMCSVQASVSHVFQRDVLGGAVGVFSVDMFHPFFGAPHRNFWGLKTLAPSNWSASNDPIVRSSLPVRSCVFEQPR